MSYSLTPTPAAVKLAHAIATKFDGIIDVESHWSLFGKPITRNQAFSFVKEKAAELKAEPAFARAKDVQAFDLEDVRRLVMLTQEIEYRVKFNKAYKQKTNKR